VTEAIKVKKKKGLVEGSRKYSFAFGLHHVWAALSREGIKIQPWLHLEVGRWD